MRTRGHRFACTTLLAVICGCQSQISESRLMEEIPGVKLSATELRQRVVNFVRLFAKVVENAADDIAARTRDPEMRRAALQWKTDSTLMMLGVSLRNDPVISLLVAWAVTEVMVEFFESGSGVGVFGEHQGIAIAASKKLTEAVDEIAQALLPPERLADVRAQIKLWAVEHPVSDLSLVRETTDAPITALAGDTRFGTFGAVQSLEQRLRNLVQILPLFIQLLPKQARWQAQLLVDATGTPAEVHRIREGIEALDTSLGKVAGIVDDLPALVERERIAVLEGVNLELQGIIDVVDRQRQSVTESIDKQRTETIEYVTREVGVVFDEIREQRVQTLAHLDELTGSTLDRAAEVAVDLVDHLFLRLVQFAAAAGVLAFAAALVLIRLSRRTN